MQLTRFSDIGLRVLMYLAHTERNASVTIGEIAAQFEVPHNHLVKIIVRLSRLGWIETTRGRNGGLRLALPAAKLRVGTVLRQLQGDKPAIDCNAGPCVLRGECFLSGALQEALDAFYETLDRYTIADAISQRTGKAIIQLHRRYLAGLDAH